MTHINKQNIIVAELLFIQIKYSQMVEHGYRIEGNRNANDI
jgi:hypothetical protein